MSVKDSFLGRLLGNADLFTSEQVAQTVELLITHGAKHSATDIHIEPQDHVAVVRYRIDGALRGMHKLPLVALPAVAQTLKELCHIHTDVDVPSEGHFTTLVDDESLEVQVTTMPVIGGEKVVLHLARRLQKAPVPEELGFWGQQLSAVTELLSRPHGIALVSGPKRAGKATTMYSLIQPLNTPMVSIATVEEHVSYRITGASQTEIHPHAGITFYEGLKTVLHQDPNIVVVGSVPDRDTANLVVQAGAHGHFVLAGTYSPSAAAALTHLRTLKGSETFLLASALRISIGQRLVRALCPQCREAYVLQPAQAEHLNEAFGITTSAAQKRIHSLEQQAAAAGIGGRQQLHSSPEGVTHLWRAHAGGCEHCNFSGYQGLLGIIEALQVTPAIQQALLADASARELHDIALKQDFVPMGLDGLVKALRGQTTVEEVLRTLPER